MRRLPLLLPAILAVACATDEGEERASAVPAAPAAESAAPDSLEVLPDGRRVDRRALALLRRADAATYLPAATGLRSLRCRLRVLQVRDDPWIAEYAWTAPDRSTLRFSEGSVVESQWRGMEEVRWKALVDNLLWRTWEGRLREYDLEYRVEEGTEVVVCRERPEEGMEGTGRVRDEVRFLPGGPVAEFGPIAESRERGIGVRQRFAYDRERDLAVVRRAALDGYGPGHLLWYWKRVEGVLLPDRFGAHLAGMTSIATFSEYEVEP